MLNADAQTTKKSKFSNKIGADNQHGTFILRDFDYDSRTLPYVAVAEEDVWWHKQYVSSINLKLPTNQPLFYPVEPTAYRKNLFSVLMGAVERGEVQAYDDALFEIKMPLAKIKEKMERVETIEDEDFDTGEVVIRKQTIRVLPNQIIEILIREERFFDKKRSVMDSRILGICPVALVENPETASYDKTQLFWLYYPEVRQLLANSNVWNPYNNFERMTMDEFFHKRMFSSVIQYESNMQNRYIYDYNKKKVDQLLEAERIKNEIRNFEHDLWSY